MIPLVSEVYTATRAVLGDNQVAGGEVFTDTILQSHYQYAYAELFRALQSAQNPRIRQEAYYNVPPFTGYIDPATMFVENLGEIETLEERGTVSSWAISGVTPGSGIATVVSAATTLATGDQAIVYGVGGISDDINGEWTVTVNSTTSTQLNGCTATGTYTAATGTLSFSNELFLNMSPVLRIVNLQQQPQTAFLVYAWERDMIRVPPLSGTRQIRLTYSLSGNAPTTTTASVGIDDSLDFLSYRIAGLAARSKGMLARAQLYTDLAVGNRWLSESVEGGILQQLLITGIRNAQRMSPAQRRAPAFGWNRRRRWQVW